MDTAAVAVGEEEVAEGSVVVDDDIAHTAVGAFAGVEAS